MTAMREIFPEQGVHLDKLESLTRKAIDLAAAGGENEANIRTIGRGWVADEALAIAVYCSLRYSNDFSKGIIAAVNHGGDSDSTGSMTGNILGGLQCHRGKMAEMAGNENRDPGACGRPVLRLPDG